MKSKSKNSRALLPLLGLILFSSNSFAGTATLFECTGQSAKKTPIQFTYTLSSIVGQPTFNLQVGGVVIAPSSDADRSFKLEVSRTTVGSVVAGITNFVNIADAPDETYSVVIPDVYLKDAGEVAKFDTVLMTGFSGGYRALPLVVQVMTQVEALSCTAKAVNF